MVKLSGMRQRDKDLQNIKKYLDQNEKVQHMSNGNSTRREEEQKNCENS